MANFIRSAKSGSEWTADELVAYNITVESVDAEAFFGQTALPPATVSPLILDSLDMPLDANRSERDFFKYMEDAMISEESHVDDFAVILLRLADYDVGKRIIHSRKELGFMMSGQRVMAKPDVCVMDHHGAGGCVLLVQEDKVRDRNATNKPRPSSQGRHLLEEQK